MKEIPKVELEKLSAARNEIDAIDDEVIRLFAKRWRLAAETFTVKRAYDLPLKDPVREKAVLEHTTKLARELGLPEEHIKKIYETVLLYSLKHQENL